MITKTIKGNLLDAFDRGDVDIIAHQCNCFCNMGSGMMHCLNMREVMIT